MVSSHRELLISRVDWSIIEGPFEVMIARAAVVEDPWGNGVVLIDSTKGPPITSIGPSRQRP